MKQVPEAKAEVFERHFVIARMLEIAIMPHLEYRDVPMTTAEASPCHFLTMLKGGWSRSAGCSHACYGMTISPYIDMQRQPLARRPMGDDSITT